ncbi:MAG: prepilin-type N-terminal cleavage/methylation domain-containing protein [Phycisphaerae bacterium]
MNDRPLRHPSGMRPCAPSRTRSDLRHSARRGFTLIELLVVVAIIAVLISILLPALQGARDQSQQLLCLTNLRSMGQASVLYAEQNQDWIIRAENYEGQLHFSMTLLHGLAWQGSLTNLWPRYSGRIERILTILPTIKQFQCPRFPNPAQPLDYVVSAFVPIYTLNNISRDVPGGGAGNGGGHVAENQTDADSVDFFRTTSFSKVNPAGIAHLTEAHASLPTNSVGLHDVFFTSQLPLGLRPRIANDRRHPGGINVLFFDGSARTMSFPQVDSGWPTTLGSRLRWFTRMPDGYE